MAERHDTDQADQAEQAERAERADQAEQAERAGQTGTEPSGTQESVPDTFPPPGYEEFVEPPANPLRERWNRLRDLAGDENTLTSAGLRTGVLICAIAVFVAGGVVLWSRSGSDPEPSDNPPPELATSAPPAQAGAPDGDESSSGGTVIVHVGGDVADPGLVELPDGARVADAVDAAGGITEDADPEAVATLNLARRLTDGEQILVGTDLPAIPAPGTDAGDAPLDLNLATVDQLQDLPGVGPVLAEAIVTHRDDTGGFSSVDELQEVSGIGEKRMEDLRDRVIVHGD